MSTILIVVAIILGVIAAFLGFGTFHTNGDPHVAGWLSASLVAFYASHLAGWWDNRGRG